jgi:hypothetical protein
MWLSGTAPGRRKLVGALLWAIFGAGLFVQALAPRLRISNRAFIIPPSLTSEGQEVNPAEIIEKERRMQLLSAGLTASGALGLALYYWRVPKSRSP